MGRAMNVRLLAVVGGQALVPGDVRVSDCVSRWTCTARPVSGAVAVGPS